MEAHAFRDNVIVRPDEETTQKTAGGILIPDTVADKVTTGTVVDVGPGKASEKTGTWIDMSVKVNDRVYYTPGAGTPIQLDGIDYLILKEDDILMLIEE